MIDYNAINAQSPYVPVDTPDQITERKGQLNALALSNRGQQLDLQQKQMDMEDQQKMRRAWQDANGDPQRMMQLASQYGVGPKTLMQTQKTLLDAATARASLHEKEYATLNAKNDLLNGLMQPVVSETDPVKQQALWTQQLQEGIRRGVLTPEETAAHPYPGSPDAVRAYAASLATDKWITAEGARLRGKAAQTQADIAAREEPYKTQHLITEGAQKKEQLLGERIKTATQAAPDTSQADWDAWRQQNPDAVQALGVSAMYSPAEYARVQRLGMTPQQRTQADQAAMTATETRRYHDAEIQHQKTAEAQRNREIGIQGARLNLERQKTGFDLAGGISPAAQMIAEGKIDPQTTRAMIRRAPGLMAQVRAVDPNFDEATIDNRYKTLQEFGNTSVGRAGGQAIALNTLIHHADLYLQTAEALRNGSFRPGNEIYNRVAQAFGSAPPTNAALVARFLAGETGKVATGGVPAEGEVNGILRNLSGASSPDQIAGAGQTLLQIAGGRATPLMERVRDAKLENVVQVLGDDARQILRRRGFDPATMKPAAGAPGNYVRTAVGADGHRIGQTADGKWWDATTGKQIQ